MLSFAKIESRPRMFRALTGLSPQAFAQLLPAFGQAYEAAMAAADA